MKKYLLLISLVLFSFSAIHAQTEWKLSEDGTLTISGTGDMPDYEVRNIGDSPNYIKLTCNAPWFPQQDKIKKVVIEDGVTDIGDCAFFCCTNLTSITIPNSVTCIGDDVFEGCGSLTSISIPNSVTSIGNFAFDHCDSLTSVTIPNSVTSLGENAFSFCLGLTTITIPNSVTRIGDGAFFNCFGLTSITIPNSVTSLGENAFSFCLGLTSITFEGSTPPEFGKDVFYSVNKSTPVYVPANSIEAYKEALKDYFEESSIQALQR
ncbi:MAG: leucine-rich repeat domain-containing protein [Bacteroidales bacterium]|nr:leucine-rich repeat domain-containing protein [Bacteroidales bacterium]